MFYPTVLKSVEGGIAVDVQGKRLTFIGYMQVQAGDVVWTDGNVIFGNAPPKSLPNITSSEGGVPVLADNMRGYINRHGKYRQKNIGTDNWIVNDDKNFRHGQEENLLDVEIVKSLDANNPPILYKADSISRNSGVNFYNDNSLIKQWKLSDYNTAIDKANDTAKSIAGNDSKRFKEIGWGSILDRYDGYYDGYFPKGFIERAKILGLKIDEGGNSHAIVAFWGASIYKVMRYAKSKRYESYFTYETNHYPVGDTSTESFLANLPSVPDLIDDLVNRITDINEHIYRFYIKDLGETEGYYMPTDLTESRPYFTCFSYALAYFKNCELAKIIDHKDIQTFFKVTDSTEGGYSVSSDQGGGEGYIGKIGSDREVWASSVAWHTLICLEKTEDVQYCYHNIDYKDYKNQGKSDESLFNTFTFPLQDGYTAEMTIWQVKAIYDKTGKKICGELPIQEPSAFLEDYSSFENDGGNIDVNWNEKSLTYANGKTEKIKFDTAENNWPCGIYYYDEEGKKQDYHMPNISVTKLSEKKYLIGFYGGNLYLSDNGKLKRMTTDKNDNVKKLKNFRLRKMKNLNNAQ